MSRRKTGLAWLTIERLASLAEAPSAKAERRADVLVRRDGPGPCRKCERASLAEARSAKAEERREAVPFRIH